MNVKDFSYIREKHRLMKHLISALTIIAISAFSFQANAQETISSDAPEAIQEVQKPEKISRRQNMPAFRNEVELSYGRATLADMAHILSGAFVAVFTGGYAQFDNFNAYGSVNAEYYRVLNKTFSVGGLVGWSGGSADVVDKNKVKTGTRLQRLCNHAFHQDILVQKEPRGYVFQAFSRYHVHRRLRGRFQEYRLLPSLLISGRSSLRPGRRPKGTRLR